METIHVNNYNSCRFEVKVIRSTNYKTYNDINIITFQVSIFNV